MSGVPVFETNPTQVKVSCNETETQGGSIDN